MMFRKIKKAIKRHPFLYRTRFKLLSRNTTIDAIEDECYSRVNKKIDLPAIYLEVNKKIFEGIELSETLEKVKYIALYVTKHLNDKPGLSLPSDDTLRIMLEGEGGVCSDMAQVFNNFCLLNDIDVREWGVTRAPFDQGYGGHAFNEVFLPELDSWILFDPFWCVYFRDSEGHFLSVTELYQLVNDGKPVFTNQFYQLPYLEVGGYKKNYFHAKNVPFLVCNYENKIYDSFLKKLGDFFPVFLIHFLIYVVGRSYHYKFPLHNFKTIFEVSE